MTRRGVLKEIQDLQKLTRDELRARWQEVFPDPPPASYRRDALLKRLTYRVQELRHGGVSGATRARLSDHLRVNGLDVVEPGKAKRRATRRPDDRPVVGTVFRREWHGEVYEVTATVNGFEFEGRPYKSLTAVARAITGTHWNGRAFFGLSKRKRS